MNIFSCLPKVDNCCFCISLKWGAVLIAILTMINFGCASATSFFIKCESGAYNTTMDIVTYVMLAANLLAFLASIVFLFGIIKHIPETAIIFMYALAISLLINLVFVILAILFSVLDPSCSRYTNIIIPLIALLVWLYFIIVINSYEEHMLD